MQFLDWIINKVPIWTFKKKKTFINVSVGFFALVKG